MYVGKVLREIDRESLRRTIMIVFFPTRATLSTLVESSILNKLVLSLWIYPTCYHSRIVFYGCV